MTTRGGPGRGQGRKPVAEGEQTVTVSLRITEANRSPGAVNPGIKFNTTLGAKNHGKI